MTSFPYKATTEGIIVRIKPTWLNEESKPAQGRYVWAYQVEVENAGTRAWTLTRRFWRIIDANGQTQHVDGEGVVGQTPRLEPGEAFRYTSGAPLAAPSGIMGGHYVMEADDGTEMKAEIPTFSLDSPFERNRPI